MSALDMYLQGRVVGQLALASHFAALVVRCVEGMYHIVDAVVVVGKIRWNNIQSRLQFHAFAITSQLAMSNIRSKIQRCTILYLTLYHNIGM